MQRIQFASLSLRKNDLKNNVKYFELISESANEGDVEKGVNTMQDYLKNESKYARDIISK